MIELLSLCAVVYIILAFLARRYQRGQARSYQVDLTGQLVIITGSSAGIGMETARELATKKATIIFACRNELKASQVIQRIKAETGSQTLLFMKLDLSDWTSIRQFSNEYRRRFNRLNILINNAGVGYTLPKLDRQGYDITFVTNHLGPFLLTNLLLDIIMSTPQSRIINVSSQAHEFVKTPVDFEAALKGQLTDILGHYSASKYANIVFTHELQQRFEKQNLECKAVAVNPGFVSTEMVKKSRSATQWWFSFLLKIFRPFSLNAREGAQTTVYTALQPYEELSPAGYYERNKLGRCSKAIFVNRQIGQLWSISEKMVGLKASK